jgi:IMP dehydrogenase
MKPAYSFDDVLLVPQHSDIASRNDVDISTTVGRIKLTLPILSSNMDTVTEGEMAVAMHQAGGAGVLHRFADSHWQQRWLNMCKEVGAPRIVSRGISEGDFSLCINPLAFDMICVDVAHGDHERVAEFIHRVRGICPDTDIIAGNVATGMAALRLVEAGANIIKVGIGPGSVCSTRVVSGHGFPQLSAIEDVDITLRLEGLRGNNDRRVSIIGDGGIRYSGDIVKGLAAGADAVMLGALLAGTDEAPGDRLVENGLTYKTFRGSASYAAQKEKRGERTPRVEGVSAKVPYRGPVADTLQNLEAGIRSGFSYSGARNIESLRNRAEFVVVTGNTLRESHPHHPYRL